LAKRFGTPAISRAIVYTSRWSTAGSSTLASTGAGRHKGGLPPHSRPSGVTAGERWRVHQPASRNRARSVQIARRHSRCRLPSEPAATGASTPSCPFCSAISPPRLPSTPQAWPRPSRLPVFQSRRLLAGQTSRSVVVGHVLCVLAAARSVSAWCRGTGDAPLMPQHRHQGAHTPNIRINRPLQLACLDNY
jgi:hypothetical protein